MSVTDNVIALPLKIKLVCSGCSAPGEGSCNCGLPYVTPSERAEAAVKAHPEKSNRAIAEEIGVGKDTVRRARPTGASAPVDKRVGLDGKARAMPQRSTRYDPKEVLDKAAKGVPVKDIARDAGVVERQIHRVLMDEKLRQQGRDEALQQLEIDPKTLSLTAQGKLDAAIRAMDKKYKAELQLRFNEIDERVRVQVEERVKDRVEALSKAEGEAWEEKKHFRHVIQNTTPIFTEDQYQTIRMCLHPDGERSKEKLNEAFRLFHEARARLILRKK